MAKIKKNVEKTLAAAKDAANQVVDTAKKTSAAVVEQIEKDPTMSKAIKDIKETTEEVTAQVKKAAKKTSDTVKEQIEKDPAVAETVKDVVETAGMLADETVKAARKTIKKAAKATGSIPAVKEIYLQFAGKEVRQSDVIKMVTDAYVAEGHKASELKEMELYIKPEDHAVYYVINGNETGKVNI